MGGLEVEVFEVQMEVLQLVRRETGYYRSDHSEIQQGKGDLCYALLFGIHDTTVLRTSSRCSLGRNSGLGRVGCLLIIPGVIPVSTFMIFMLFKIRNSSPTKKDKK